DRRRIRADARTRALVCAAAVSGKIEGDHAMAAALETRGEQTPCPAPVAHAVDEDERAHRRIACRIGVLLVRYVRPVHRGRGTFIVNVHGRHAEFTIAQETAPAQMLNPHIFRAYDVRGLVGADVDPGVFEQVGRAYGTLIRRHGGRRIAVGQDNRTSSADLKATFTTGARAAGIDVVDIGVVTTPILYFATAHCRLDGGANITGSHNPFAYDGDADRVGIVDERGRRHEADLILVLLARDLLRRHPGAKIVFDVKSSQSLIDEVRKHGGVPVMWKTGHSHLKRKMREDGILLGGEVSGHMFFAEGYYGVDDGLLGSCKIIEIVAAQPAPASTLFDSMEHLYATPESKAMCPYEERFRVVDELLRELKQRYETVDIDGARVQFPSGGWGLVRASNTNPYLTLRFEARSEPEIDAMKRVIYDALRRYPSVTLPD